MQQEWRSRPVRLIPEMDGRATYEVDPDFFEHAHRVEIDQPALPWEPQTSRWAAALLNFRLNSAGIRYYIAFKWLGDGLRVPGKPPTGPNVCPRRWERACRRIPMNTDRCLSSLTRHPQTPLPGGPTQPHLESNCLSLISDQLKIKKYSKAMKAAYLVAEFCNVLQFYSSDEVKGTANMKKWKAVSISIRDDS